MAKKSKKTTVTWLSEPAVHDYPAAQSFLRLIATEDVVTDCTTLLSQAATVQQHAKDILRAARLPLLPHDVPRLPRTSRRSPKGASLSPILLIAGDIRNGRVLQIADGYHSVCASYYLSEDTEIPCRLVTVPEKPVATA